MARERKHFEIEIRDLTEEFVDQTARLHKLCFPRKIESVLGVDCIADCLRRRYIQPHGDCYCRIAILKSNGKVVSYCHAESLSHGPSAHAFLSRRIARKHLLRKIWFSPGAWAFLARRIAAKVFGRGLNERDTIAYQPDWEVAKMLAIDPEVRGGNVGVDMMLDNEREARRRGATRICGLIEKRNVKAARLYESIGWERDSPDTDRFEVFAMHKKLSSETGTQQAPSLRC